MLKAKHQQLFDILKEEFLHGEWRCGAKLPSLVSLSEKYSVSINIASKAVELLKNEGMVETKVGDGIYSTFKGALLNSFHYSGDRVYGHYRGAKPLRILVEDDSEPQKCFWNDFFQKFSSQNPDIEIEVQYHCWNDGKESERCEAVLGGHSFLQKMVPPGDKGLSLDWVNRFKPGLYKECIFGVSDFSGKLPYGFSSQLMLAASDTPRAELEENIMEYLERWPEQTQGFLVRSSRLLLGSMGIDMARIGTEAFTAADGEEMLSVFQRAKKLYASGRLIWPHGKFLDIQQMIGLLKNQHIQAMGQPSNAYRAILNDSQIQVLPYPHGGKPCITMHFMHISQETLYPEEYLRLLQTLLSSQTQQCAESSGVFYSIRQESPFEESNWLRKKIQQGEYRVPDEYEAVFSDAFYNFLGWEFYYYLEGRRGDEVVDIINQKIQYFYEHTRHHEKKGKENDELKL